MSVEYDAACEIRDAVADLSQALQGRYAVFSTEAYQLASVAALLLAPSLNVRTAQDAVSVAFDLVVQTGKRLLQHVENQ